MAIKTLEKVSDKVDNLENDFNLAFKLVFFDENDEELEPAQYKALSTFSVERDMSYTAIDLLTGKVCWIKIAFSLQSLHLISLFFFFLTKKEYSTFPGI
ncbi:MAG: hypothetical protein CM15mP98_08600 [Paracoccaceae bacterium]|nr:MAG: hypothetical protein CM15mP98_08600 [Paracoccaceae bacterium]